MNEIEQFFFSCRYTSLAFFSSVGFILAVGRISALIFSAYLKSVSSAVEQGLTNQRQDNQGDVINEFVGIIKEQQKDIKRYCKAKEDDAIDSALCKTLLANNNITPIDIPK